ncbi:unnamed protein product [Symbiodinium necroappetens]|uniref:Uncharacterized protein n=1 Tax=Symbiodinium necroappetens TaxID=1628268 RepID=A0A813CSH7_9DINO|nr:unnamed protein product [Symbiodinium microadriaticum]CAE7945754.1 unnamed protein product [Symbiodinium necroappetens]
MLAIANTQANSLAQRSAATESAFQYHLKARRDVQFGPVPVAESNTGVIVVHQYIGLPPNIGQEIVRHDDYIRSQDWTKLHMPRSREEIMHQADLQPTGEGLFHGVHGKQQATRSYGDSAAASSFKMPRWRHLSDRARLSRTGNMVAHVLSSEIMNERGVEEFFSRPEAVSHEESRSV